MKKKATGKKIKKLNPDYQIMIDQVNRRRIQDNLKPTEIKVLECQYCRCLFESVGRKSCGCTRVEGHSLFQED